MRLQKRMGQRGARVVEKSKEEEEAEEEDHVHG
jgi:hypothetical protein